MNFEQNNHYNHHEEIVKSSVAAAAAAAAAATSTAVESDQNGIPILEDDIIDQRDRLSIIYKVFFEKCVSQCDPTQNIYMLYEGKLSKPLQRKLISMDQTLRSGNQIALSDVLAAFEIDSETSYEKILERFGENFEALFHYTSKNQDYKNKLFRLLRSICERVLIYDASLCDQYHYQVQQDQMQQQHEDVSVAINSAAMNTTAAKPLKVLWNELRNRSCQFLGPQVQEDVLHFILRALELFPRLSRRVLVSYVVFMLKKDYPKISKTSIGHVVQLLYRAGCFKVEKRDKDTSLMELKREFTKYESLRRQHDAQIIQIGMESGIRMTPEKWSQTLYGDSVHKSEMQSIIDKLQSVHTIDELIDSMYEKLDSYGLCGLSAAFDEARADFDFIASINFEKKLPRAVNSSLDDDLDINDPFLTDGKMKATSPIQSDEDQRSDCFEEKNSNVSYESSDYSRSHPQMSQKPEVPQVRIRWSLLASCLQRSLNILKAHAEFSSKLMSMIIANQNLISASSGSINQSLSTNGFRGANSLQQSWSQHQIGRPFQHRYQQQHHHNQQQQQQQQRRAYFNHNIKKVFL